MKNQSFLVTTCVAIGFATIALAAPPPAPAGTALQIDPAVVGNPLPKGVRDKLVPPRACAPDLTIASIILTRSGPTRNLVRVSAMVRNVGADGFMSDPRQVGVMAVLTNGNTNGRISQELGAIANMRAGASQALNGTPVAMPFDTFEFGGEVSVSVSYDPDILLDSQPCNDDRVFPNNRLEISNDAVRAWLGSPSNSLRVNR